MAKRVVCRRGRPVLCLAVTVLALSGCASTKTATGESVATLSSSSTVTSPKASSTAAPAAKAAGTKAAGTKAAGPGAAKPAVGNGVSVKTKAGSSVVTDAVNSFSVRLPAGYTRITDASRFDAAVKAGVALNPKLKAMQGQYLAIAARARVFAFKLGSTSFTDNFNILASQAGGMDSEHLSAIYASEKPVMEQKLGAKISSHRIVRVSGTKAMRIEYRLAVAKRSVRGTQLYLVHKGKVIIVTITQNDVAASTADANQIITSLNLT